MKDNERKKIMHIVMAIVVGFGLLVTGGFIGKEMIDDSSPYSKVQDSYLPVVPTEALD